MAARHCAARLKARRVGVLTKLSSVKKTVLREALLRKLREELDLQLKAAALAHDEATNEESRARSKYDTHSQEAAYLAQGQMRLARETETSLEIYSTLPLPDFPNDAVIAIGAVVELEAAGRRSWYFVGPRAGGLELSADGRAILVLTPQSPLGRQLIGRQVGQLVQSPGPGGTLVAQAIVRVE